jgi:hypothetical protein
MGICSKYGTDAFFRGENMNKLRDRVKLCNMILLMLSELRKTRHSSRQKGLDDLLAKWNEISNDSYLHKKSISRSWYAAAEKIKDRTKRNINDLSLHFMRFKDELNQEESKVPVVSDLLAEMQQTEEEFGEITLNLKEKSISVVTEAITMEDVSLGSFEIILQVEKLKQLCFENSYRIVALDPYPASSDENVTHPHVSCEALCEGDGYIPIRKALREGRLCDFFTIVTQILNTYNPDSPYVSISDWYGNPCYDCGYTVSGGDSYYCENCNNDFCDQCSGYCKVCEITHCRGCMSECPDCQEPVCQECFDICQDCERSVCKDCMDTCVECNENFCINCLDENGICDSCIENRKETEDEETIQTTAKQTVSAVHPFCMD